MRTSLSSMDWGNLPDFNPTKEWEFNPFDRGEGRVLRSNRLPDAHDLLNLPVQSMD